MNMIDDSIFCGDDSGSSSVSGILNEQAAENSLVYKRLVSISDILYEIVSLAKLLKILMTVMIFIFCVSCILVGYGLSKLDVAPRDVKTAVINGLREIDEDIEEIKLIFIKHQENPHVGVVTWRQLREVFPSMRNEENNKESD